MMKKKLFIFLLFVNYYSLSVEEISKDFKLGLENISDKLLKKLLTPNKKGILPRIGLITNQTGIDQNGKKNYEILLKKGLKIKSIYVPEHGMSGKEEAEKKIFNKIDIKTKLPIISLYEGDSKFKNFTEEDLKDIDLFIFDMQDSGMRHYTYVSILYKMMEVAIKFNKKFIVFDRPNPLGIVMEGPLVEPELISFVSIAPIPLRHGMTFGELALYFNKYNFKNRLKLFVVRMKNYSRTRGFNNNLPIYLSPNLNNIQACLNYSFLGIIGEIYPFSVLVGTKDAFKAIMLPKSLELKNENFIELQKILKKNNVSSVFYSCLKKDSNKKLNGLKIKINNINDVSGINCIIEILKYFKSLNIKFSYSKLFNKVLGTTNFKDFIENNNQTDFINKTNKELRIFFDKVKDILIYQPLPKLIEINKF